ncbi:unnamed protein product [Paramecium sonneborni]|uniref:Dynactin subunit 6 n=1 Tax=Paramecium sonneborni TaxID=65129 RepID=A0A8S1RFI2_9CILI|nr:unnamed protein product [Paramecium sonneborni]
MSLILSQINKDNVKIGKNCCIALGVQIISEIGEIIIGDYTIIEEGCMIRNNHFKKMIIGSYNVFEIGCKIENTNIGDCNVFEMRCLIESGCTIENNCRFGINSRIPPKQIFHNFSRVYYPFNCLKVPQYDSSQHKEEITELCFALIQIGSKK